MALPSHPFWDYSLALYGRPGVADACLVLQDEYGLDVNLVLFCLWTGMQGPGELSTAELHQSIALTNRWQTEVVGKIRALRRALKHDDFSVGPELAGNFRPQVQALELLGEHVEQLALAKAVPLQRGATGPEIARSNLRAYLAWAGIDSGGAVEVPVQDILRKAFQDG